MSQWCVQPLLLDNRSRPPTWLLAYSRRYPRQIAHVVRAVLHPPDPNEIRASVGMHNLPLERATPAGVSFTSFLPVLSGHALTSRRYRCTERWEPPLPYGGQDPWQGSPYVHMSSPPNAATYGYQPQYPIHPNNSTKPN